MKYEENNIDLIIANGEKAKNARGINKELFERIIKKGYGIFECLETKIFVANLIGKDCNPKPEYNAFQTAKKILENIDDKVNG